MLAVGVTDDVVDADACWYTAGTLLGVGGGGQRLAGMESVTTGVTQAGAAFTAGERSTESLTSRCLAGHAAFLGASHGVVGVDGTDDAGVHGSTSADFTCVGGGGGGTTILDDGVSVTSVTTGGECGRLQISLCAARGDGDGTAETDGAIAGEVGGLAGWRSIARSPAESTD